MAVVRPSLFPGFPRMDRAASARGQFGRELGAGMLAEEHMLAQGAGAKELSLARHQVIKASGAEAPG